MRKHTHKSGITVSGDHPFVDTFIRISQEHDRNEKRWVDGLIQQGIKAAHPDDGWNDREAKRVSFCYPYFNHGVEVGDLIALGDFEKYKVYRVAEIKESRPIPGITYYHYRRASQKRPVLRLCLDRHRRGVNI